MNTVVVGASRGIGRALATALAARGDRVLATVRTAPPPAPGVELIDGIDVCDEASVARLRDAIDAPTPADTGKIIGRHGELLPY